MQFRRAFRLLSLSLSAWVFYMLMPLTGVSQIVSFNQISHSDGLRNGNVRAIIKDYQGFIWFGTEDGLHRYDGSSMRIYRKDESDSTSLSSNFILCLFEDSQKHLWIGTLDGGLCLYDRVNDRFARFNNSGTSSSGRVDNAIRVMYETADKELFVGSSRLLRAKVTEDPNAINFTDVDLHLDATTNVGLRIMGIDSYQDSLLLLGFNNRGLYVYNPTTDNFYMHPGNGDEKHIQSVYVDDRRKLIWAGTWKNGLLVTDYTGAHRRYIQSGSDKHTLRNNYVPELAIDSTGNLWVGTDHGLSLIPPTCNPLVDPQVETYLPDPQNQSSILGSIIKAVYVDCSDNLWVGIYYNGVSVYNKRATHFGSITFPKENNTQSPGIGSVSAMAEDTHHTLWIGTDGSGLYTSRDSLDNGTPPFTKITSCAGIDKIKAMALDKQSNLWIGTWGNGLFIFNTNTHRCSNFTSLKTGSDIGTEVTSVEIDHQGDIWIGTFDNGVSRYRPSDNTIVHLKNAQYSTNFIDRTNVIYAGKGDDIWIGKEAGGLGKSAVGKSDYEIVQTAHVKSSTTVTSISADDHQKLWLGCPSRGLVELDLKTGTSILYTEQDGLANSMIYAILEDSKERLWISTDAGLTVFDKATHKFSNFGLANGLLSNQFNKASALATQSGYLIFGNIRGANYVPANTLTSENTAVPLIFTKLLVNNKEQLVGKPGSVLQTNILITPQIDLAYDQNSFAVEVASLSYDFSLHREYYYKLVGFNETWQYAGDQSLFQYTNLEPGTYTLYVRTSPEENSSRSSVAMLKVVIHPAWWQTITFRVALMALVVVLGVAVHRIRIHYLLKQKKQLEEQVEQRTHRLNEANELLQMKLTEINSMNDLLKGKQDEIIAKNNEILAQNEELTAQNDQIAEQHEKLIEAQKQLRDINLNLEKVVDDRTVALQTTIDDLNKIVFELDRFVYSASHDLSAPLKSILGLVQIIQLESNSTNVQEYAELIRSSVRKLENVIKSMVDYAWNSHVEVSTKKFMLNGVVEEVFSALSSLPAAKVLTFENKTPSDLIVQNDSPRVKVILRNLVDNSIRYIDKSKPAHVVSVEATRKGRDTLIRVRDNGIGIRQEYIDKIFNMYFRGTEVSKGSGLGLFLVKETVNKIGGKISVHSVYGEGTTFEVVIPELSVS